MMYFYKKQPLHYPENLDLFIFENDCLNPLLALNPDRLDYWNKHHFGLIKNYPLVLSSNLMSCKTSFDRIFSYQSKYRKVIYIKFSNPQLRKTQNNNFNQGDLAHQKVHSNTGLLSQNGTNGININQPVYRRF